MMITATPVTMCGPIPRVHVNPVVTFTNTFPGIALADIPAFVLPQLVGVVVGAALARWPQPSPEAAT